MTTIRLFSAQACPYAHRTRLVLAEKAVPFDLTEVDLQNKPQGFNAVSAYGKVPALEHAGHRLYESAIVNEYLDEVFPTPPLLPSQAGPRADRARSVEDRDLERAEGAHLFGDCEQVRLAADVPRERTGIVHLGRHPGALRPICKTSATIPS